MHARLITFILAISMLCVSFIVGCTPTSNEPDGSVEFKLGSVSYKGNEITAQFEANPSTGWNWTAEIEGDAVHETDSSFVSSRKNSAAAGAPGTQHFSFVADKAGEASIFFTYKRPWEDYPTDAYYQVKLVLGANGTVEKMEDITLPNPK